MKLRPVIKLDKTNMATLIKFDVNVISTNCDIIVFFQFMCNLQPSGSLIPDAWSIKLTFSLREPENKTKKSLTQLLYYCFK